VSGKETSKEGKSEFEGRRKPRERDKVRTKIEEMNWIDGLKKEVSKRN
jgi:hypothetical protein